MQSQPDWFPPEPVMRQAMLALERHLAQLLSAQRDSLSAAIQLIKELDQTVRDHPDFRPDDVPVISIFKEAKDGTPPQFQLTELRVERALMLERAVGGGRSGVVFGAAGQPVARQGRE